MLVIILLKILEKVVDNFLVVEDLLADLIDVFHHGYEVIVSELRRLSATLEIHKVLDWRRGLKAFIESATKMFFSDLLVEFNCLFLEPDVLVVFSLDHVGEH